MRQFQASDFSAERSGKCALFMPKELAFQQPSRNRRTVELDETAILSQTHTVDGASDEFLTRTRFPQNQYSGITLRHCPGQSQHSF